MKTLAFYSYKGGTGRSLLVAVIARYLALLGKRVVALDFDFEAPGLHYKLRTSLAISERGAVDYLLAIAQGDGPPESLDDYVVAVPLPWETEGSLRLIPAGSAPSGEYWKALTALYHHDLFTDPDGYGFAACLELKARIEEDLEADYLLIDLHAGVTELAAVATTVLADRLVCLMLDNRESQEGARAVLRSLRHAVRLAGQRPLEMIPVLSRVEQPEPGSREALVFMNEPGPTADTTLDFEKVFVLRTDRPPESRTVLGGHEGLLAEKLGLKLGRPSTLHEDYLALLTEIVDADRP